MDDDHEGKKILVIQTHGVETPRRTYSPLFYAMAASAMEMDVLVWFTMDGTNQLKKGAAEKVQLDPTSDVTLKTMLEQTLDVDVRLLVCQQSRALFDMTQDDLIDGVEILGATSIIDLAWGASHVILARLRLSPSRPGPGLHRGIEDRVGSWPGPE